MADKFSRVIIGAYVEPRLKNALVQASQRSERSISAEIRVALRAHLGLPAAGQDAAPPVRGVGQGADQSVRRGRR